MKKFLAILLVFVMAFGVTTASAEWLYATKGDTHIRVSTDVNSNSLGVFLKGEKIWVTDHIYTPDGRNWCMVSYYGQTGYISDRYSSYEVSNPNDYRTIGGNSNYQDDTQYYSEGYELEDSFPYECNFEFILTRTEPVRTWADRTATAMDVLNQNQHIWGSRIDTSNGEAFLEVIWNQNGEYQYGYVSMSSLMLAEPLFDGSYPGLAQQMKVTGGSVNVRQSADINAKDIGTIHQGDIVSVIYYVCVDNGERRIWACCTDQVGNYLGFVSCKYLAMVAGE